MPSLSGFRNFHHLLLFAIHVLKKLVYIIFKKSIIVQRVLSEPPPNIGIMNLLSDPQIVVLKQRLGPGF